MHAGYFLCHFVHDKNSLKTSYGSTESFSLFPPFGSDFNKAFTFLLHLVCCCAFQLRSYDLRFTGKTRDIENVVLTQPRVRLHHIILNRPIISLIAIKGPLNEGKHFFIELNFIGGLIQS